jgi:hypothetical protein
MPKESTFQSGLIKDLKSMFPGCLVTKNDPTYIQGFPDLLVLFGKKWAALECKRDATAPHQPNQNYYVEKMKGMSYASFVCPENKEQVLNELQQAFRPRRATRLSGSK